MKLATEHYAQIPYALIASPAWSVLNIHERRTIDRMLIEHARHWKDNGRLVITTRNLKAHGVHPRHVSASLKVIEALGLVECTQRGRGGYAAEFRRPSFWRWVKIETIEQAKEIAEKHRVHETRGHRPSPRRERRSKPEPREIILVTCSKCDWKAAFRRADLAAPDCSKTDDQWDRCGVYYVEPIEGSSRL
jgi:hypothetical protein